MKERRYALLIGLAAITTAAVVAIPALAGPSELSQVRAATARYHSITQAEMAGYRSFLGCFDSADGGMGQHYVDQSIIDDGVADPLRPEALVYEVDGSTLEVGGSKLSLVGVEWVEVGAATDTPLALFGEEFEYNPDLGVWALHAWIWRDNPDGIFADFNSEVADCPLMIPAWLP